MKILNFKAYQKATMLGFVDIEVPEWNGFQIYGITVFDSGAKRWINFPSRKLDTKNEKTGKDVYFSHCKFAGMKESDAFAAKVLIALDDYIDAQQNAPEHRNAEIIKDIPF